MTGGQASTRRHGSVARRILLAIFLAAAVPLGMVAVWTLLYVNDELVDQALARAHDLAKNLGMEYLGRLHTAADDLRTLADLDRPVTRRPPEGWFRDDRITGPSRWLSLFKVNPQHESIPLFGDDDPLLSQLASGLPTNSSFSGPLFVELRPYPSASHLYLLVSLSNGGWLGGRLNPGNLWNAPYLRTLSPIICYLDQQGKPYFCNKKPPRDWLTAIQRRSSGRDKDRFVHDPESGEMMVTGTWSFVHAMYENPETHHIAVGIPASEALAPMVLFRTLFPRMVVIALIIVGLLSWYVIHGNLRPLRVLLEATSRVRQGHLDTKVILPRQDEFQVLGAAFNSMTGALHCQFQHLSLAAELGQVLQERRNYMETLTSFLSVLPGKAGIQSAGVVAVENHEETPTSWIITGVTGPDAKPSEPMRFESADLELLGQPWTGLAKQAVARLPMLHRLCQQPSAQCAILPASSNGRVLANLLVSYAGEAVLKDREGVHLDRLAQLLTIALQKAMLDEQLVYRANHDVLTGLVSRDRMVEEVKARIEAALVAADELSVMMIYVDNLESVTDASGHALSDRLLVVLSQRLRNTLTARDILSRFDGGTFVAVLGTDDRLSARTRALDFAAALDEQLSTPVTIGQRTIQVTATKGIAIYPSDATDEASLLRKADAALHAARHTGRGRLVLFNPSLEREIEQRSEVEQALTVALERGELELYYQPISDPVDTTVAAAEALIRWQRPDIGIVSPGVFIPVAEETGLIETIGAWVIRQACKDFQQWRRNGLDMAYVSVNVSGRQLIREDFAAQVAATLEETGLPPQKLTLEVTETALIGRLEDCVNQLEAVRRLGVRVAIDDFGTGYASLKYVKQLPADIFKVDRLFVSGLPQEKRDATIIAAVRLLARDLDVDLVAEGVETAEQVSALEHIGIRKLQGYFYSRPLPLTAFTDYLARHQRHTERPGHKAALT